MSKKLKVLASVAIAAVALMSVVSCAGPAGAAGAAGAAGSNGASAVLGGAVTDFNALGGLQDFKTVTSSAAFGIGGAFGGDAPPHNNTLDTVTVTNGGASGTPALYAVPPTGQTQTGFYYNTFFTGVPPGHYKIVAKLEVLTANAYALDTAAHQAAATQQLTQFEFATTDGFPSSLASQNGSYTNNFQSYKVNIQLPQVADTTFRTLVGYVSTDPQTTNIKISWYGTPAKVLLNSVTVTPDDSYQEWNAGAISILYNIGSILYSTTSGNWGPWSFGIPYDNRGLSATPGPSTDLTGGESAPSVAGGTYTASLVLGTVTGTETLVLNNQSVTITSANSNSTVTVPLITIPTTGADLLVVGNGGSGPNTLGSFQFISGSATRTGP